MYMVIIIQPDITLICNEAHEEDVIDILTGFSIDTDYDVEEAIEKAEDMYDCRRVPNKVIKK